MVSTILQSFSFTLYKSYTCPLIQTFCASPNSFHLRADCSLCNTTLKPLTTKIQCYTVLIYSTCNQIKTSSCSSSYSRYYKLVHLSVCVLVVFSCRALIVVLQKIILRNTFYDLYRSEAEFAVIYVKTVTCTRSFECNFLVELQKKSEPSRLTVL